MDSIIGARMPMTICITKKEVTTRMKETRKEKEAKENNKGINDIHATYINNDESSRHYC